MDQSYSAASWPRTVKASGTDIAIAATTTANTLAAVAMGNRPHLPGQLPTRQTFVATTNSAGGASKRRTYLVPDLTKISRQALLTVHKLSY